MKNAGSKKPNYKTRILAGVLAALMLAGIVFGVVAYLV